MRTVHSYLLISCSLFSSPLFSQHTTVLRDSTPPGFIKVIPGKQYVKGEGHQIMWGSHYRMEWGAKVKVPVVYLDTLYGGVKPVEKGGGRQTRNLRLEDKHGKQYVLRSIDKTYERALPEEFSGTFIETIANDQVSAAHPFAPFTVPPMASAAKIYHTNPRLVFLPEQKALDSFNNEFANQLYLVEERPDGDQHSAPYFGNAPDVISTQKMMDNVLEDNNARVDQQLFLRSRLFDIFVGDWGRHEDQWRWGVFALNKKIIYRPIPRDRDQTYSKFDGLVVSMVAGSAAAGYLHTFDHTIRDINKYNYLARHLDRRFLNEMPLETWLNTAKELQRLLTNVVIENAVRQIPPEVFALSGNEIIAKLKSRREHLVEFAREYYTVLAKEVDIPASQQSELIRITGNNKNVTVELVDGTDVFYSRTFDAAETKEIRVYGIAGADRYVISGDPGIRIRLIGGAGRDIYEGSAEGIEIYDDRNNTFNVRKFKLHYGTDSAFHAYDYNAYKYNKHGIKPGISYSADDRFYLSLGYTIQNHHWRKTPFAYRHDFSAHYSISQKAYSLQYEGLFNQVIGKWNIGLMANYDRVKDVFYPGIGNNVIKNVGYNLFYRTRTKEFYSSLSFIRPIDAFNTVTISGFYKTVQLYRDPLKYTDVNAGSIDPSLFEGHRFAGAKMEYLFETINNKYLPTKGLKFNPAISYNYNLTTRETYYRLAGVAGFYAAISSSVVLLVKAGGATVSGNAPFYELNRIGGGNTLRGNFRYRFYGKTSFYNQNELVWNIPFKTYIMNGTLGLVGFFDNGRVWQPGEISNNWHYGYGGGFMIAPFNKISFTAMYGISDDDKRFHVRVGKLL